jgi:hypothetical protein
MSCFIAKLPQIAGMHAVSELYLSGRFAHASEFFDLEEPERS